LGTRGQDPAMLEPPDVAGGVVSAMDVRSNR
jgi:hypothetical protein